MTGKEKNSVSKTLTNVSVCIEVVLDKMKEYSYEREIDDSQGFAQIFCILKNVKDMCYSKNDKL